MAVYIDNMRRRATVGRLTATWSHLFADTTEELVEFAKSLGLRPEWIQHGGTRREHFDVVEQLRTKALAYGALEIAYPQQVAALLDRKRMEEIR